MRGAHQSSATQPRACHNSLLCQWLAAGSVPELGQPCSLMLGLEVPCRWSGGKNAPSAKAASSFARGNGVLEALRTLSHHRRYSRAASARARKEHEMTSFKSFRNRTSETRANQPRANGHSTPAGGDAA